MGGDVAGRVLRRAALTLVIECNLLSLIVRCGLSRFLHRAGVAGRHMTQLALEDFNSIAPDMIPTLHDRIRVLQERWGWSE